MAKQVKRKTSALIFAAALWAAAAPALAETEFTFAALGDLGANANTDAVLKGLRGSGAGFAIFLGDLSYDEVAPEAEWRRYVRSHLGESMAVELVAGNHEENGEDGFIDEFAKGFPDRMGSTGDYAREYFFDYPKEGPLARFIQISPDLDFPEGPYSYAPGSEHFAWLDAAVTGARQAGIRWVIVSLHKNCISMGDKKCEIGPELFNFLIGRKVDLILQGHEHNYQRSRPLALGPACPAVRPNVFDGACVAAAVQPGAYRKGEGATLLILGTGGRKTYPLRLQDPEKGYFVPTALLAEQEMYGYGLFQISRDRLAFRFVRTGGGAPDLSDAFEIRA